MSADPNSEARDLARKLMWEPPGHDDFPGVIPDKATDVWNRFAAFAVMPIDWRKVDGPAWRAEFNTLEIPDYEAWVDGQRLLLVEAMFSGFPDPPAWSLYLVDGELARAVHLGAFDWWPAGWSGNERDRLKE